MSEKTYDDLVKKAADISLKISDVVGALAEKDFVKDAVGDNIDLVYNELELIDAALGLVKGFASKGSFLVKAAFKKFLKTEKK